MDKFSSPTHPPKELYPVAAESDFDPVALGADAANRLLHPELAIEFSDKGGPYEPSNPERTGQRYNEPHEVQIRNARISELETTNKELAEKVYTDELTGLPNGNALKRDLASPEIANNPNLAVISIDLKNFKAINDLKGHDYGDKVLQGVAQVLAIELAAQDSDEDIVRAITEKVKAKTRITDRVYRSNQRGDEMIILADMTPRPDSTEEAESTIDRRAQKLRDKVFTSIESYATLTALNDVNFSASIGFAVRHTNESPTELLSLAEQAMYEHKRTQTETLGAYRSINH